MLLARGLPDWLMLSAALVAATVLAPHAGAVPVPPLKEPRDELRSALECSRRALPE